MPLAQRLLFHRKGHRARRKRCRGAEVIEFTLLFIPVMAMITTLVDSAWAVWAQATLQRAAKFGVRAGVTLTYGQTNGGDLTTAVKTIVQQQSLGILGSGTGSSGYAKIKVHYFQPQQKSSASPTPVDVSGALNGNAPGNIMQVSVENFTLIPLVPRIFSIGGAPDKNPTTISVYAADIIEPNNTPPPIGAAP